MLWARRLALIAILSVPVCAGPPASAQRLITSLSTHRVMVTSSFTGYELVLFGAIEGVPAAPRRINYDIVVTVTGPRLDLVTRRKDRLLGIWVNRDVREFNNSPAYLAVLSNRPLDAIASEEVRRRQQLGIANIPLRQRPGGEPQDFAVNDPFRQAFVRLMTEHRLYREQQDAVTFLTPTLFRASIPLPAQAPVGSYEVDVKLFADGAVTARASSALEVFKAGIEQFVANAARDHGLLYGLATTMMALFTGWLAAVIFRRD